MARWGYRGRQPRFGTPRTYTSPEGANVTQVTENVGYGFTHYTIVGTPDAIAAEQDRIYAGWPPQGYSTFVYWPPEKCVGLAEDVRPVDNGDGTWTAKGWRANSCD